MKIYFYQTLPIFVFMSLISGSAYPEKNESVEEKISQITSILQTIPQLKEVSPKEEVSVLKIYDKNFSLIEKFQEEIQEIFEEQRDSLISFPNHINCILDFINIFQNELKNIMNSSSFSIIDSNKEDLLNLNKSLEKFSINFQNTIMLLRVLDSFTSPETKILEKIKNMDNNKILSESEILNLNHNFVLLGKYDENDNKILRDLISSVSKTNFENQGNIPSYFVFNFLQNAVQYLNSLGSEIDSDQLDISRLSDDVSNNLKRIMEDLNKIKDSSSTPSNIVPFLKMSEDLIQEFLNKFKKSKKDLEYKQKSIRSLVNEVSRVVNELLRQNKDKTIFEKLTEN